jgi:UrcA family protein
MYTLNASTHLRGLITTAILGALALGFVKVSAAADASATRSVTVMYGDLNLSEPKGAATLYSRIVWAAREVCEQIDDTLTSRALVRACVNRAIAEAVTKVGHPKLIALYNAKNPQPLPVTVAQAR